MQFVEFTLAIKPDNEIEQNLIDRWDDDLDVIIYSGEIGPSLDKTLINIIEQKGTATKVLFLLTTYGGDADAAYRTARFLQRRYDKFTLGVMGDCKSAGTILAFGANEVIMSPRGEFGPLDVQMFRPDEFVQRTSGTIISQALSYLSDRAFDTFEDIFLAIRRRSGGIITTQTAADIATSLCGSLFSPITEKIDPMRIGEMQRSMDIAIHYAIRLGGDREMVEHLAKNYPCHSFVIDIQEAKHFFKDVREPNNGECLVLTQIMNVMKKECGHNYLCVPPDEEDFAAIVKIVDRIPEQEDTENAGDSEDSAKGTQEIKPSPSGRETSCEETGAGKTDSPDVQDSPKED